MRDKKQQLGFLIPEYRVSNIGYAPASGPIVRVVVLPIQSYENNVRQEDLKSLQSVFNEALLKTKCFECIFLGVQEVSSEVKPFVTLSITLFESLHEKYQADAVLFLGITHYSPYVPLKLGVRAQLVALADLKSLWCVDEIFDARREDIMRGLQLFQERCGLYTFESLNNLGQISPKEFATYVAEKIWSCLPERF